MRGASPRPPGVRRKCAAPRVATDHQSLKRGGTAATRSPTGEPAAQAAMARQRTIDGAVVTLHEPTWTIRLAQNGNCASSSAKSYPSPAVRNAAGRHTRTSARQKDGASRCGKRFLGKNKTPIERSAVVDTQRRRSGCMPDGGGVVQDAKARGNARDTLTWTRLSGW